MRIAMEDAPTEAVDKLDERWREGRGRWARKLGRLRLGVEPLDVQLDRYRKMTWALTAVTTTIGVMFVALFWAFSRPDVGLILAAILLLPVVAVAWIDYLRLALRARAFERALEAYQTERRGLLEAAAPTDATPKST
jgi:hypothetical protein